MSSLADQGQLIVKARYLGGVFEEGKVAKHAGDNGIECQRAGAVA
jgi:hypothetical protein